MGVADARAMHPGIEVIEVDGVADRRLLEGIADWCDRYTPLVAIEGEDGLFLDIAGCAHLFGGEKSMLDDVLARLFDQGFYVRGGLASTPGAAWAAARFALPPVECGREEEALAPLPLAVLRLPAACRDGLQGVGLRTAGAVFGAPRAPLVRRFGRIVVERIDQALGSSDEPVSPRLPVAALSVERHLAEPVMQAEAIEQLALVLAAALEPELERRGEGARRLELALFRVDGVVGRIGLRTSRPVREPSLLGVLLRERLAGLTSDIDAGCGFEMVRLSVLAAAALAPEQADLAGDGEGGTDDLAVLADRVEARFGAAMIGRAQLRASHLPERAAPILPLAAAQPPASRRGDGGEAIPWPERPVRLFEPPEPVEVMAGIPEGPPVHFRWRRALHRVLRSEGPERMAPEWWREPEATPTRDYFRVEDEAGRRYWLCRHGLYDHAGPQPRWFIHGLCA